MDWLASLIGNYWGSVTLIAISATVFAYVITRGAERYEKARRRRFGTFKPQGWEWVLRAVSTACGLAVSPLARYALTEIFVSTISVPGMEFDISRILPSLGMTLLIGATCGFFLTGMIWFWKWFARTKLVHVSPELAARIQELPDLGEPTIPIEVVVDKNELDLYKGEDK